MTPETFLAVVTILTPTLISIAGVAWALARRQALLETKLNICWDFVMRRATSEGVNMGVLIAPVAAAVTATDEARTWFNGLKADLRKFYREVGRSLTERQLFVEVERRFGDRLLHEVCIPHGMIAGACIWAAIDVARGTD